MFYRAIWIGIAAMALMASALFLVGNADKAHASGPAFLSVNVGKSCTVQFRRDLLGATSDKPVSPTVRSTAGGAEYAVSGTLTTVQGDWVVVQGENRKYFIPQDTILLIEIQEK